MAYPDKLRWSRMQEAAAIFFASRPANKARKIKHAARNYRIIIGKTIHRIHIRRHEQNRGRRSLRAFHSLCLLEREHARVFFQPCDISEEGERERGGGDGENEGEKTRDKPLPFGSLVSVKITLFHRARRTISGGRQIRPLRCGFMGDRVAR